MFGKPGRLLGIGGGYHGQRHGLAQERPCWPGEKLLFEDISGSMEGAINLVADSTAGIGDVMLRRIRLRQCEGQYRGCKYDLRPTRFDLAPSKEAAGRANAWGKDEAGRVIGLVAYPGGQPGIFASNIDNLPLEAVAIERPETLPEGWNRQDTVLVGDGRKMLWS